MINRLSTEITLAIYDIKSVSTTNSKLSVQDPKGSVVMLSQKLCGNKDLIQ